MAARTPRRTHWLAAVLGGVLLAGAAGAQGAQAPSRPAPPGLDTTGMVPGGRAVIVGQVRVGRVGLPDVELTLTGEGPPADKPAGELSVRTSASGVYRVDDVAPGRYLVRVRRLGYEPIYFSATIAAGTKRRIDAEMTRLPAQLAAVEVRRSSGYNWYADKRLHNFEFRRGAGFGNFFTRDDLRAYRGRMLSDALRYIAVTARRGTAIGYGLDLPGGLCDNGGGSWIRSSAYAQQACVSVNGGALLPLEFAGEYSMDEIEALEMYGSTVVIWTGVESDDDSR